MEKIENFSGPPTSGTNSPSLVPMEEVVNIKNRKFLDFSTSKTNSPSLVPMEEVEK